MLCLDISMLGCVLCLHDWVWLMCVRPWDMCYGCKASVQRAISS